MLIESILADQKSENMTAASKNVAKHVAMLMKTEKDKPSHANISNNTIKKKDGVITVKSGNRVLIEAVQDENDEWRFKFDLSGSMTVKRLQALKEILQWKFDIGTGEGRLWIIVNGEAKPLKRGLYTAAELELLSVGG